MKKILILFTLFILTSLLLDYTACRLYCSKVNDFFDRWDAHDSDATVVFFGDFGENYRPGEETVKRLRHVHELFRSGRTQNIICAGGNGHFKKSGISGAAAMKEYLVDCGIPQGSIYCETESYDSYTNWTAARKIIVSHKWRNITPVSSAMHLYRLKNVCKDDSLNLSFSPYSRESIDSVSGFFAMRQWIHHEWIAIAAQKLLPEKYYRILRKLIV